MEMGIQLIRDQLYRVEIMYPYANLLAYVCPVKIVVPYPEFEK